MTPYYPQKILYETQFSKAVVETVDEALFQDLEYAIHTIQAVSATDVMEALRDKTGHIWDCFAFLSLNLSDISVILAKRQSEEEGRKEGERA